MSVICKYPVGSRFGRLVVVENSNCLKVECICDCGKSVFVRSYNLVAKTRSCGCLATEHMNRLNANRRLKHAGKTVWEIIDTDEILPTRFWSRVAKSEGCWEWTGSKDAQGYGHFGVMGKIVRTHRLSFYMANGYIDPTGKLKIMHTCDNPSCVNPDHLRQGTQGDNMRDCVAKNRHTPTKGEDCSKAKLSESDVLYIRASYANKQNSIAELASRFGTSKNSMWKAATGRSWQHIPMK